MFELKKSSWISAVKREAGTPVSIDLGVLLRLIIPGVVFNDHAFCLGVVPSTSPDRDYPTGDLCFKLRISYLTMFADRRLLCMQADPQVVDPIQ